LVLLSSPLKSLSSSKFIKLPRMEEQIYRAEPTNEGVVPVRPNVVREQKDEVGLMYEMENDATFDEFTVLLGNFIGYRLFTEHATRELGSKGFRIVTVTDECAFVAYLPRCDVAWVLSGNPRDSLKEHHRVPWLNIDKHAFTEACLQFHRHGGGLFVWADNDPLFEQANAILPSIVKIELIGESPANRTLTLGNPTSCGHFGRHMITGGRTPCEILYEGFSVCYPKDDDCGIMKVLATSTDNHPCILYADADEESGRVIVDCGWTKLATEWENTSTAKYILYGTVWLLGLPDC